MSRLSRGFGELEMLALGELLEIYERIENLIDEKSENECPEAGRVYRPPNFPAASSGLSKRGRLVAPKYRNPWSGATWNGRGKEPRWMVHLIQQGAKREDFRIGQEH